MKFTEERLEVSFVQLLAYQPLKIRHSLWK